MKKLIGLLTISCVAGAAWGQGTVNFNNNVTFATPADRLVYWSPGRPLVGTEFFAQLYFGTRGTAAGSLTAVGGLARFRVPTTSVPGTWSGGTRTLTGILPGQTARLQVRVWTLGGPSPDGGWYRLLGASAPFDYTVPPDGSSPTAFFIENFRGFTLVPEPPSIALVALGALVLWLSQRRRPGAGFAMSMSRHEADHQPSKDQEVVFRP